MQLKEHDLIGYSEGPPEGANPENIRIDRQVVAEQTCDCGGSYEYRGYHAGTSYRAFAICRDCGDAIEF